MGTETTDQNKKTGTASGQAAQRRLLPQWALSNTAAATTLLVAAAIAFLTTWILMSPLVEQVDRSILMGMVVGNLVIAALFAVIVGARLFHVLSERRHQLAGSRTHLQLIGIFSALAVIPAVIAFLFAFTILRTSLNDVFSDRIEKYQETARDLARGIIEYNQNYLIQTLDFIAQDIHRQEALGIGLEQTPISYRDYIFIDQTARRGLSALYILDANMRILVRAEVEPSNYKLPSKRQFEDMNAVQPRENGFLLDVTDNTTYDMFVALRPIEDYGGGFIVAYYRIDPETSARILSARSVVDDWEEAKLGRSRLERVFLAGYVVLAIIILFGAIWLALWAATRLVQPIGRLVKMAERVSGGELDARVEVYRQDGELGVLARSMNHMTAQLQTQRDDLIDTNRQFDERRRFTEAVLSGVSAGVIGLSDDGCITLANKSAAEFLEADAPALTGRGVADVMPELCALLDRARFSPFAEIGDQINVTRHGRMRTLNVRIVKDEVKGVQRFVATFDDITQLIAAQRNAAWGDVARRIAHEIKNPLTPIQLSAERLRRKYLGEVTSSPEVFDKCTETIIRQVSDIGRMVDEFSSFARMPKPVIEREDLRELVKSAVFPQKVTFSDVAFEVETPGEAVFTECDGRLIVQALSNLLKNAGESVTTRMTDTEDKTPGRIVVSIEADEAMARVHIRDNGVGLPEAERHRLTEPYMTTRAKGTGLGLAIVKKVAEEHGGGLDFTDDNSLGAKGARITFFLPRVMAEEETPPSQAAAE